MQEKIFKIKWDDELGEGWMNLFNLELCLFSKEHIGGSGKDNVIVEELNSAGEVILALREPIITTETLDQVYLEGKQAGIKEVVEWIETKRYSTSLNNVTFRTPIEEWQAKLKEWGIE